MQAWGSRLPLLALGFGPTLVLRHISAVLTIADFHGAGHLLTCSVAFVPKGMRGSM